MKKIYFLVIFFMFLTSGYTQVKLNVWDKSKSSLRTSKTIINPRNLPKSFESKTPDGGSTVYERWNRPSINVKTSNGKSLKIDPIVYKSNSKNELSIITLTQKGWIGIHHSKNSYKMSYNKVSVESAIDLKIDNNCLILRDDKKIDSTDKLSPPVGRLTNLDFYDSTIFIEKTCSLYVEAANDIRTHFNSTQETIDYINLHYQAVSFLFYREGIKMNLYDIYIWETPDPYTDKTSVINTINEFNSRVSQGLVQTTCYFKQLLSSSSAGGVAYLLSNANGYSVTSPGVSSLSYVGPGNRWENISDPTDVGGMGYSILTATHELGHCLGSSHTHKCNHWRDKFNNPIARIDSCFLENSGNIPCTGGLANYPTLQPDNSKVPTIMSYCGLLSAFNWSYDGTPDSNIVFGKNFSRPIRNGFGLYPRWAIRASLYYTTNVPFDDIPTVKTNNPSQFGATSALASGEVVSNGGYPIISRGFVWSTTPILSIDLPTKSVVDGQIGTYTYTMTDLLPNTVYYVTAYATNSIGTSYGIIKSFATSGTLEPTVQTLSVTFPQSPFSVACQSAQNPPYGPCANVEVKTISQGNSRLTNVGVLWSTMPGVTESTYMGLDIDGIDSQMEQFGTFTLRISQLPPDTFIYVRSICVNLNGLRGYGNEIKVRVPGLKPVIKTNPPVKQSTNVYKLRGKVLFSGQTGIQSTSFQLSKVITRTNLGVDGNPVILNGVAAGDSAGVYTTANYTTEPDKLYQIRFKASNQAYTTFGQKVLFFSGIGPSKPIFKNINIRNLNDFGGLVSAKLYSPGSDYVDSLKLPTNVYVPNVKFYLKDEQSNNFTILQPEYFTEDSVYFILNSLTPGTIYKAFFASRNSVGLGTSDTLTFTTSISTPVVSNLNILGVGKTSVNLSAKLDNIGASDFPEKGFVISTEINPLLGNPNIILVNNFQNQLQYYDSVQNLTPNTTYFVKGYAKNVFGVSYTNQLSFKTLSASANVITRPFILGGSNLSTIKLVGEVIFDPGLQVSSRGFVISKNPNPTFADTSIFCGNGFGVFESPLLTITIGQNYYVRAYAAVDSLISFGEELIVTIPQPSCCNPVVSTLSINSINQTTVEINSSVTDDGGLQLLERGILYSTTPNIILPYSGGPEVFKLVDGQLNLGDYVIQVPNLAVGTTYFMKAYAKNQFFVGYGEEIQWTVFPNGLVRLSTKLATEININSAKSGGIIVSDGGSPILEKGLVYSTSPGPSVTNADKLESTVFNNGGFDLTLNGLTPFTTYYVKAYAINYSGTSYGEQISFKTLPIDIDEPNPCTINGIQSFINSDGRIVIRFPLNQNCGDYDLSLQSYGYTNPNVSPPQFAKPWTNSVRLKNYFPRKNEMINGYIDHILDPQPKVTGLTGRWFSVQITCNGCFGDNVTKFFFYVSPP